MRSQMRSQKKQQKTAKLSHATKTKQKQRRAMSTTRKIARSTSVVTSAPQLQTQQQRSFATTSPSTIKFGATKSIKALQPFSAISKLSASSGIVTNLNYAPEANIINTTRKFATKTAKSSLNKQHTLMVIPQSAHSASSSTNSAPFHISTRGMALQKPKAGKDGKDTKKKTGGFEVDPGEEAFASAGDVKKNLRNWLEQIIQSKPEITPMPQAAIDNEELFVKECQMRFAQRLDERSRFEQAKIIIKQRAIAQLPGELKVSATKPDPSLWSMRVMTPFSDPPRKRWLHDHYGIPYKASQHEIDDEDFLKKKYARL